MLPISPERAAFEVLARFSPTRPRVDVVELASSLGDVEIRYELLNSSGLVISDDQGHTVILVSLADAHVRQRFTVAHEVGHLWLERLDSEGASFSPQNDDDTERWCDAFAAAVLIPREWLSAELMYTPIIDLSTSLLMKPYGHDVSAVTLFRRIGEVSKISVGILERTRGNNEWVQLFPTQHVDERLVSNAFMSLARRFPPKRGRLPIATSVEFGGFVASVAAIPDTVGKTKRRWIVSIIESDCIGADGYLDPIAALPLD